MEWLAQLKACTPVASGSEYTFAAATVPRDEQRVVAVKAFRHLGQDAYSLAKRSIDDALTLLQTLPAIAGVWFDAAAAQFTKDVYSGDWNEVTCEAVGVFVALCRLPYCRDIIACDRALLSSITNTFLLSAQPDVLNECLRLFAACMLAVGDAVEDREGIAAAAVVASADVVKKATFVAENRGSCGDEHSSWFFDQCSVCCADGAAV